MRINKLNLFRRRTVVSLVTITFLVLVEGSLGLADESSTVSPHQSRRSIKKIRKDFAISTGLTPSLSAPTVAYNSRDDEYMVVWADCRDDTLGELNIFGQRLSSSGEFIGGNFLLIDFLQMKSR
jgi:hypothetical protein